MIKKFYFVLLQNFDCWWYLHPPWKSVFLKNFHVKRVSINIFKAFYVCVDMIFFFKENDKNNEDLKIFKFSFKFIFNGITLFKFNNKKKSVFIVLFCSQTFLLLSVLNCLVK